MNARLNTLSMLPASDAIHWPLLFLVLVLSSFGWVMVTSSSMAFAEAAPYYDPWYFSKRYAIYWVLGVIGAVLVAAVPVSIWEKYGSLFLIAALLLLTLVLIPGVGRRVNGSQRWLQLGPLAIQASELVKFCVVLFYASFLARRGKETLANWQGVIKPLAIIGLIVFLLLLEPDFGASVVMAGTVMAMLFVAGVRLWQFFLLMITAVGSLAAVAIVSPYRMQRLVTFLDPWADQFDTGYQLIQSLIAFGRGEWFGLGLGNSVQKLFYLPEAHTDFIFAIVAEEFGLVGVVLILAILMTLIGIILSIALKAMRQGAHFISFASFGLAIMFASQVFINVGVASGLLPTKGLTMPFISYGGSSLLVSCMFIGLMLRMNWELKIHATGKGRNDDQPLKKQRSAKMQGHNNRASGNTAPILTDTVEAA